MSNATYAVTELNVEGLLKPDSVAFEVPEFQRRYAWRSEEVEELLADLYECCAQQAAQSLNNIATVFLSPLLNCPYNQVLD